MRLKGSLLATLLILTIGSTDSATAVAQKKRAPLSSQTTAQLNRSAGQSQADNRGETQPVATSGHSTSKLPPPKVIEIPSDQLLPAPANLPVHTGSFNGMGNGTAIIFTPDLAAEANRQFYQALGFLYLEDASWQSVLEQLSAYNKAHANSPITRVILETHGSWGDGLKLQDGKENNANRSYISLGGLQERLELAGVKECILSACNSGRLLRPEIYRQLDSRTLLPANRGTLNASKRYRPTADSPKILRRRDSRFEALTPLFVSEMPKLLRTQMGIDNGKAQLVVSDLFLEYILQDPNLTLIDAGFVRQTSIRDYSVDHSEALILRFFELLNQIAANEGQQQQFADSKDSARESRHSAAH